MSDEEVCLPHSGLLGEHADEVWYEIDKHADLLFFEYALHRCKVKRRNVSQC